MSDNTSHKDEEIDLGQLLNFLVRLVKSMVNAFGNVFKRVTEVIFLIFLFFKRHFIKFAIVGVVGAILGGIFDYTKDPEYEATMVVKPNYNSSRQLYKNVAYYDELVRQQRYDLLQKNFKISEEEAKSLVSFEIEPVINENHLLSTYDEFLASIDSNLARNFDYDNYKENFPDYWFAQHEIVVVSIQSDVFLKLEPAIVSGIVNNEYFMKLEAEEKKILDRNEEYLMASLEEVDTLRKIYQEVLIIEAKKEVSKGTSINMATTSESTKEIDLFSEEVRINSGIDKLKRTRIEKSEILNVVSDFQDVGFEKKSVLTRNSFKLFVVSEILIFLVLLFLDVSKGASKSGASLKK